MSALGELTDDHRELPFTGLLSSPELLAGAGLIMLGTGLSAVALHHWHKSNTS